MVVDTSATLAVILEELDADEFLAGFGWRHGPCSPPRIGLSSESSSTAAKVRDGCPSWTRSSKARRDRRSGQSQSSACRARGLSPLREGQPPGRPQLWRLLRLRTRQGARPATAVHGRGLREDRPSRGVVTGRDAASRSRRAKHHDNNVAAPHERQLGVLQRLQLIMIASSAGSIVTSRNCRRRSAETRVSGCRRPPQAACRASGRSERWYRYSNGCSSMRVRVTCHRTTRYAV